MFSLEAVVADLGYGDVRPLPGSVAWIDKIRAEGKRTALVHSGESAAAALEIAGISDRFDAVCTGPRDARTVEAAFEAIAVTPDRAVVVDIVPEGLAAAREAGCRLTIAIARSSATPSQLRQGGATAIVADLQELLGREGSGRRRAAEVLLRRGLPAVVATDAHAPARPYTLDAATEAIGRVTGRPELGRRLAAETPARLLADGLAVGRRAA